MVETVFLILKLLAGAWVKTSFLGVCLLAETGGGGWVGERVGGRWWTG